MHSSRGRRVTSLGVLFDFTGNDVNTTVQKVEDMVKETWVCVGCQFFQPLTDPYAQFAEAIKEEPDFFLLAGYAILPHLMIDLSNIQYLRHMPVANDKCKTTCGPQTQHSYCDFIRAIHFQRYPCCAPGYADSDPGRTYSHS